MKSVYNIEFCDTVYLHFSDEVLANMAVDFLRVFRDANFKGQDGYHKNPRLFSFTRHSGNTCVMARPDSVSIDFSKATTQAWACQQIYDAETLIEEVMYRAKKRKVVFDEDIDRVQRLGAEIQEFIDKFCVPVPINANDVVCNAQQTCEMLRI